MSDHKVIRTEWLTKAVIGFSKPEYIWHLGKISHPSYWIVCDKPISARYTIPDGTRIKICISKDPTQDAYKTRTGKWRFFYRFNVFLNKNNIDLWRDDVWWWVEVDR